MTLTPPLGAPPRLHRARRRMRAWLIGIAAVVVVGVVVTALIGGFGDRAIQKVSAESRGAAFDTGEVTMRVLDARIESSGPAIRYPEDGKRWLVVDAVLENHTDAPVPSRTVSLLIGGATYDFDARPQTSTRLADGNDVGNLQPELPTRIGFVWPIENGARITDRTVRVGVIAQPRKLGDPVFDDATYDEFEPIARVDVPLRIES